MHIRTYIRNNIRNFNTVHTTYCWKCLTITKYMPAQAVNNCMCQGMYVYTCTYIHHGVDSLSFAILVSARPRLARVLLSSFFSSLMVCLSFLASSSLIPVTGGGVTGDGWKEELQHAHSTRGRVHTAMLHGTFDTYFTGKW